MFCVELCKFEVVVLYSEGELYMCYVFYLKWPATSFSGEDSIPHLAHSSSNFGSSFMKNVTTENSSHLSCNKRS